MRMLLTVVTSLALVLAPASSVLAQHEGMDMGEKKEEPAKEQPPKEEPAKEQPAKDEPKSGQQDEHAGHQQGDHKSVKGELVDLSCYTTKDAKGDKHAECAQKCAADGAPMGVLTADGTVYLLVPNHDKEAVYSEAKKHCGHMVEVTGHHAEKGKIHVLAVSSIKMAG